MSKAGSTPRVCGACGRLPQYAYELTLCPNCGKISLCDDCLWEHIRHCSKQSVPFRGEDKKPTADKYIRAFKAISIRYCQAQISRNNPGISMIELAQHSGRGWK